MASLAVYITTPTIDEARRIARTLVEERLAACVNILPPSETVYHWGGAIETATESTLIAKTRADRFDALLARVRSLHSHEVPCVVALPVVAGNPRYLEWLAAEAALPVS